MTVGVAVSPGRIPAWQRWCIDALREVRTLDVFVHEAGGTEWRPTGGLLGFIGGEAMAPARVALDLDAPLRFDVVLDLRRNGAPLPASETWRLRLGDHDDPALPFVDEIAGGARTFDVTLERCGGGSAEVLRTARLALVEWYPNALAVALHQIAVWPATLLGARADGIALPSLGARPRPARGRAPLRIPRAVGAVTGALGATLFRELFEVVEWNAGMVAGTPARLLREEPLDVQWLPQPSPRTFLADPFVVEREGRRVVFAEHFCYGRRRGLIEAVELDAHGGIARRIPVLESAAHLSYPYPIEIDGELYLVPESYELGEIALYRCVRFPDRWKRDAVLLPGIDGVDATIFPHDGRWWLLCTRFRHGANIALYAFHASTPRGPWEPHRLNPIVTDVSSARPAGQPFVVDGALYRPGQDCTRSYGCGLTIARVDELSPTSYRETVVRRLDATGFARWNRGIHTVSFTSDCIVVDGKHTYYDPRKLPFALGTISRRIGRLLARRAFSEATSA